MPGNILNYARRSLLIIYSLLIVMITLWFTKENTNLTNDSL